MSFTREELINIGRASFDYRGGVRDYLDNPAVTEIWNKLNVSEREDFASLCVLTEALVSLENDRRRREERDAEQRERERREKRSAARRARKGSGG